MILVVSKILGRLHFFLMHTLSNSFLFLHVLQLLEPVSWSWCCVLNSSLHFLFCLQLDKAQKNEPVSETKVAPADSTSELETVRRIDAGLSFKHAIMAMLILLISAIVYVFPPQKLPL
jgi:hypothetical protein